MYKFCNVSVYVGSRKFLHLVAGVSDTVRQSSVAFELVCSFTSALTSTSVGMKS
ncbi:hypothetical protein Mapa_008549 [Marchantia paleacea]|nr:hypothetical protein Mapa_008549 [Marchantia paleacea]